MSAREVMAMPDVWATFDELDAATQKRLADVLETRAADPEQAAMRHAFLADNPFARDARVLDVGGGTGVLTRMLARRPGVARVVGVDRGTALAEAVRVLRPAGALGIFDGDYATTTVALGDDDPVQACVDAMMAGSVHDRWIVRRLVAVVRGLGLEVLRFRSHGFADTASGGYMLTIVDRGADMLRASGRLGAEAAAALSAEARRRVEAGTFFGHIAYASLVARTPGASR